MKDPKANIKRFIPRLTNNEIYFTFFVILVVGITAIVIDKNFFDTDPTHCSPAFWAYCLISIIGFLGSSLSSPLARLCNHLREGFKL